MTHDYITLLDIDIRPEGAWHIVYCLKCHVVFIRHIAMNFFKDMDLSNYPVREEHKSSPPSWYFEKETEWELLCVVTGL